jgi:hypothetical protein
MRWTWTFRFRSALAVVTAVRRELATLPAITAGVADENRNGIAALRTTQAVMAAAWRRCARARQRDILAVLFTAETRLQLWMELWADDLGMRDQAAATIFPAYQDMVRALWVMERELATLTNMPPLTVPEVDR